ncbi:MAG: threonine synthase [Clostridia bacterium]|nr:threonine synthase [Clostridia bacterium]
MNYSSTRDNKISYTSTKAIIKGLSPEGGLFVPDTIPFVNFEEIGKLSEMNYRERAKYILSRFLTDFTEDEIDNCVNSAYTKEKFGTDSIAPIYKLNNSSYILELWHGPTCAFKDMALQILPHLLVTSLKKNKIDKEIVILVATSGDTGKAALEGFADVAGTRINVFYPQEGVSKVQKLQMITQSGNNVNVSAVKGNFDDAQNGVKQMFTDEKFNTLTNNHNFSLSSANSINWGRLVPQIVYYFSAYADMVKAGEIRIGDKINVNVPTGNFGNILAAFYAKQMGLPINKLICSSNSNNVLTDFIKTGIYDRNRKFNLTISPSMDILISSNLERFLYILSGNNADEVNSYMQALKEEGKYEVSDTIKEKIESVMWGGFADDSETKATIREIKEKYDYVIDTHTAVAVSVQEKYVKETGDETKTVIASTASPFKFSKSVMQAIKNDECYGDGMDEFEILDKLSEISGEEIPKSLAELKTKTVLFDITCEKDEMQQMVKDFLRL